MAYRKALGEEACKIAINYCARWVKPDASSSSSSSSFTSSSPSTSSSAPPSPSPRVALAQAQPPSLWDAAAHKKGGKRGEEGVAGSRDQRATRGCAHGPTTFRDQHRDLEASAIPVLDPFCGHGSVLAVANAGGLDAYGIDLCAASCRVAVKHTVRQRTPRPEPSVMDYSRSPET